jgi:TonB family protein
VRKNIPLAILALTILPHSSFMIAQAPVKNSDQANVSDTVLPKSTGNSAQRPEKVYHVGGDVKPPRVLSSFQSPLEIDQANRGNNSARTGSTLVGIVVGSDGTVRSAKVLQSFERDLDAKAVDFVKQWKFEPATKKSVPVAVELAVKVDFHFYK